MLAGRSRVTGDNAYTRAIITPAVSLTKKPFVTVNWPTVINSGSSDTPGEINFLAVTVNESVISVPCDDLDP